MKKSGSLPQITDLGIPDFFTCHTCLTSPFALRLDKQRKTTRTREAQWLQTKGKKLNPHDMKLIDRNEKIAVEGNDYELNLMWNRDLINRSAVGMPPDYAHITKNGRNFALIGCSSNINGFFVEAFHLAMENPAWRMNFNYLNINTIPFRDILVRLPL